MATSFDFGSFLIRWLFAAALVFGTYNPTSVSYVGWLMSENFSFGPVPALVGIGLLICWIIYVRSTFLAMGWLGVTLGAAFFACVLWLFIDLGLLSLGSAGALTWMVLFVLSLLLATGMSWAFVRRGFSGQLSVDDVED